MADCNDRKADTIARLTELGCHVLADKPLVTTFAGLDKVEAAAQKSGKQIGLMLLERYNAPTRRVREEIYPVGWERSPASRDCRRTSSSRRIGRRGCSNPTCTAAC